MSGAWITVVSIVIVLGLFGMGHLVKRARLYEQNQSQSNGKDDHENEKQ